MNEQLLGVDAVIGRSFPEDHTVMEFNIGPLKNAVLTDYLPGGRTEELLKTFYRFFVPADVDAVTSVNIAGGDKGMILHPGTEPVLGYTSVL